MFFPESEADSRQSKSRVHLPSSPSWNADPRADSSREAVNQYLRQNGESTQSSARRFLLIQSEAPAPRGENMGRKFGLRPDIRERRGGPWPEKANNRPHKTAGPHRYK